VNCHTVATLLGGLLDGDLSSGLQGRVMCHLSVCTRCRDNYTTYADTVRLVALSARMDEDRPLPKHLIRRITHEIARVHKPGSDRESKLD
jgi:predicted anti-sigma-YlaC factor YlaD